VSATENEQPKRKQGRREGEAKKEKAGAEGGQSYNLGRNAGREPTISSSDLTRGGQDAPNRIRGQSVNLGNVRLGFAEQLPGNTFAHR
jgi:hypothetical protein